MPALANNATADAAAILRQREHALRNELFALTLRSDSASEEVARRRNADRVTLEPVAVLSQGGPRPWFDDYDPAAGYYWPRRGLMKKPGVVRVVVGPPFLAAGREVRELNEEIQTWVEATVKRLAPSVDG